MTDTKAARPGPLSTALDWKPTKLWQRVLIVLLVVVPLLISLVFMWAMWDPSKYLRDVDLAVVNEDIGAEQPSIGGEGGGEANFGEQVVQGFHDRDFLKFNEVSAEEARDGLMTGEYLFTVTIPKDFSEKILTVMDETPVQPQIQIGYNDYNGTNGQVLTSGVVPVIQSEVAANITKGYAEQVINGLNTMGDGLKAAADGAGQLDDGATQLKDGAGQLDDGVNQLGDGVSRLSDGANQLDDGADQLGDGVNRLGDGANQLNDGAGQLYDGLVQAEDGSYQLEDGTVQLGDGAAQIDDGVSRITGALIPITRQAQQMVSFLPPVIDTLRSFGAHEQADKLQGIVNQLDASNPENIPDQLTKLEEGTALLRHMLENPSSEYRQGISTLQGGLGQLKDGAAQLKDGTVQLQDGTVQLKDGTVRLKDGTVQLKDGTVQLSDGTVRLKDGTTQLVDGTDQLKDGTGELSSRLGEGAEMAPSINDPAITAQHVSAPVHFDEQNNNPVQTLVSAEDPTAKTLSGGLSILLIVLFGFVFMAVASTLVPHALGRVVNRYSRTPVLLGLLTLTGINAAILLGFSLISAMVGWRPDNIPAVIGALAFTALAGAAIFQFLRATFGRLYGGLIAVGFLIYGTFSFGGVWPMAITPLFFKGLHWFNPMTYARYAFIRASDGIIDSMYVTSLVVLGVLSVVLVSITAIVHVARVRLEEHRVATSEDAGATRVMRPAAAH